MWVADAVAAVVSLPRTVLEVGALARDARAVVRRVDAMLDDVEPIVGKARETQRQVDAIAAATGRLMGVVDTLPGAALLGGLTRRRQD
jgi:hypothetical protein